MTTTFFTCNACGAAGRIRLDGDDHQVEVCPSCGNSLDSDHDSDEEIDDE